MTQQELELPKGWAETNIGSISELIRGVTYKKEKSQKNKADGLIPVLRANNFNETFVLDDLVYLPKDLIKPEQIILKNDIIISMSSGSKHLVGKSAMAKSDMSCAFGAFCGLVRPTKSIYGPILGFFFQSPEYRKKISSISRGVNINNLRRDLIESLRFPLPPLNEQKRIVSKIEELFSLLDDINQKFDVIKKQLDLLSESLLIYHIPKTFFGILDKSVSDYSNFEKEKNKILNEIPEKWDWSDVSQISSFVTDGSHNTPQRLNKGELMLSAQNVRNGYVDMTTVSYVSKENFERELKRCKPQKNDILMVSVGATIGRTAIVRNEPTFMLTRSVALIRPSKKIMPQYLLYWLQNFVVQKIIKTMVHDTARGGLYLNKIKKIPILFPSSHDTQKKMVVDIELLKSYVDYNSKLINDLEHKITTMKNLILKKAFQGKLVPQDPNDEPASVLLERIKKEKLD